MSVNQNVRNESLHDPTLTASNSFSMLRATQLQALLALGGSTEP